MHHLMIMVNSAASGTRQERSAWRLSRPWPRAVTWTTSGAARPSVEPHPAQAKDGALDLAQLHSGWGDRLACTLRVPLAPVTP